MREQVEYSLSLGGSEPVYRAHSIEEVAKRAAAEIGAGWTVQVVSSRRPTVELWCFQVPDGLVMRATDDGRELPLLAQPAWTHRFRRFVLEVRSGGPLRPSVAGSNTIEGEVA